MVGFKNRYMVVEVNLNPNRDLATDDPIILTNYNLTKAIKDSILLNFGDCGLASSLPSLQVKYVNHITKVCVIRASRHDYRNVWSAITLVNTIGNCPVLINLLDLSGSIRACRKAAVKCEESKLEHHKLAIGAASLPPELAKQMQHFVDKIKMLEH